MSLVGPRPTLAYQVLRYDERQRGRRAARPGLTGLAQIHGRNRMTWPERIEWDLSYLPGDLSLRLDLVILARHRLGGAGAGTASAGTRAGTRSPGGAARGGDPPEPPGASAGRFGRDTPAAHPASPADNQCSPAATTSRTPPQIRLARPESGEEIRAVGECSQRDADQPSGECGFRARIRASAWRRAWRTFANGTTALSGDHACRGHGPGDEVIVPSMTFDCNGGLPCRRYPGVRGHRSRSFNLDPTRSRGWSPREPGPSSPFTTRDSPGKSTRWAAVAPVRDCCCWRMPRRRRVPTPGGCPWVPSARPRCSALPRRRI